MVGTVFVDIPKWTLAQNNKKTAHLRRFVLTIRFYLLQLV